VNRSTRRGRPAIVREKFDLEGATGFGGANLLVDYAQKIGLRKAIRRETRGFEKRDNAIYPLASTLELMVFGRVLGVGRLHEFEVLENDDLLRLKLGLRKMPDTTLLYRDLERLSEDRHRDSLHRLARFTAGRVLGKEVILDMDSTVETVYGQLQGAAVGYNPTKHGRASYHPILVFDGISRAAIRAELRPGNAVAATDALSVLDRSLEDVTKTGAKVIGFRGDRGFQGEEIFKHLEDLGIDYAIKTAVDRKLADWAADLTFREIGLDGDDILEAAEGTYQRNSWSRPRRVVYLRKRIASGLCTGATYDQQAIVTTLTADPEDVYHFYNQRCAMENLIREAKDGFGIDEFSSRTWHGNYADLLIKLLAYNLTLAFQQDLCSLGSAPLQTIRLLRRWTLHVPAILVRHARGWTLRLACQYRRDGQFERMRRRLQAISC
jgi:hypothetical protein